MQRNKVYQFYNEQAKNCDPLDFWGQVKRSINGKVVGQDQIDMIAGAILSGLQIAPNDVVLDLCCGNGILSDLIFTHCAGGVGVDFSDYLIDVARKHFENADRRYILDDVETYVSAAAETQRFTRVLCYSSFQYFSPHAARAILIALRKRFPNVTRLFLGNLPDRSRSCNFYFPDSYVPGIEDDFESPIGLWRTQTEFADLAQECGWVARFGFMPETFYAAHYRYDAVLAPAT